uniref:Putative isac anti-complement n=1 Tax=Ixodes ricinus TaxID=34613 RepID=A0A0K8RE58_IXORI
MDIRRIPAYFLFSVLLVLGDAQKLSGPATPKAPKNPKTTGIQAKQQTQQNASGTTAGSTVHRSRNMWVQGMKIRTLFKLFRTTKSNGE